MAKGQSAPWPQTLLPSAVSHARIFTFGYDAYVVDWRGVVSQDRIAGHAWSLLAAISHYREADSTVNTDVAFIHIYQC